MPSPRLGPPLTTVHQDFTTVGRLCVDLLLQQVDHPTAHSAARHLVPTSLVVRASTAPAPAA
ncbi:substrate-binding domain-containing protein [Naumannella halotolerans]|uniref:substrate-binding domain-containing protein n=1 Tax=Naumannella halotolerans TaxID=993414 RepID=UPI00370DC0F4